MLEVRRLQRGAARRRRTGATATPAASPSTIPIGPTNEFAPPPSTGASRRRSSRAGGSASSRRRSSAGAGSLIWKLSGRTATASSGSARLHRDLEVRKVVVPTSDRASSRSRSTARRSPQAATGRRPGRSRSGLGEGTVSETAGAGTSLADYDSSVECTRNGTVEVSVPGTKVDGAVARRRRRRLHLHQPPKGHAAGAARTSDASHTPTPPTPPTPADAAHASAPPLPPGRPRCSTSS